MIGNASFWEFRYEWPEPNGDAFVSCGGGCCLLLVLFGVVAPIAALIVWSL